MSRPESTLSVGRGAGSCVSDRQSSAMLILDFFPLALNSTSNCTSVATAISIESLPLSASSARWRKPSTTDWR